MLSSRLSPEGMMRAWWLVAVLAVVGCKQEAGPSPGQAAAPGDAPGPTAKAPAPPPPPAAPALLHVGPRQLWDAYADNEVAADMKYRGKQVEVTGLIQDIAKDATDNILISLDMGEMMGAVMCLVPDEQMQAVAELSKGQLVAFHGTVRGLLLKRPVIKDCRVAWAGPKPKEKVDAKQALATARGLNLCAPQLLWSMKGSNAPLPDGGVATELSLAEAFEALPEFQDAIKQAKADLEKAGVSPLPCSHPALFAAGRCEILAEQSTASPECRSAFIKASLDAIK